jgi:ubiquinone/menaquinone biosynthesis C-methylase UbiE
VGFYRDRVLPRLVDKVCDHREIRGRRAVVSGGLHGTVVELGAGSGLNLPHLPAEVRRLLAVEPVAASRRLAERRLAASPVPVELIGASAEHLPLDDGVADGALSTFTLCTIPDVDRALRELRRVLRPGGELHFLEHGLSPDPRVARWQHRLTPIQRRVAGGCHLDRAIDELLVSSGFEIAALRTYHLSGPKVGTYAYEGVARRP